MVVTAVHPVLLCFVKDTLWVVLITRQGKTTQAQRVVYLVVLFNINYSWIVLVIEVMLVGSSHQTSTSFFFFFMLLRWYRIRRQHGYTLTLEINRYKTEATLIPYNHKFQPGNNMRHVFSLEALNMVPARISIFHYEKLLPLYSCPTLFFVRRAALACLCWERHLDHEQCGCRWTETNWPRLSASLSIRLRKSRSLCPYDWAYFEKLNSHGQQKLNPGLNSPWCVIGRQQEGQRTELVQMWAACLQSYTICLSVDNIV